MSSERKLSFTKSIVTLHLIYAVVTARCRVQYGKYSPSFSQFLKFLQWTEVITKYKKRGKYLPILHETTCDNYFVVKYLLKLNVAYLLTCYLTCLPISLNLLKYNLMLCQYRQAETKSAIANLTWLYFYLNISIRIFCTLFICLL